MKTIGILGGMGPLATLDLYRWIIDLTPAKKDQDHLPILINNIPQIPDRTKFLLGKGDDPRPHLYASAKLLEEDGATLLAIPCNTAHAFIDDIAANLKKAEIINMLEETKNFLLENFPLETRVGILATNGTINTGLYQKHLDGFKTIIPAQAVQNKLVMESIYGVSGIKAGNIEEGRKLLREAIKHLKGRGADIVVLGCSEISLCFRRSQEVQVPLINPVKILAQVLVERSIG